MEDQHQDELERKTCHNLCDFVEVPHLKNYFLQFLNSTDMAEVLRVNKTWNVLANETASWNYLRIIEPSACDEKTHPFSRYQGLKVLKVDVGHQLEDEFLIKMSENCPNLRELDLYICPKLTDKSIVAVTQNCTKLQKLRLTHCNKLTDKSITSVAENCPNLQVLNLVFDRTITDASILTVTQRCPELQCISLEVPSLEGDFLFKAGPNFPNLRQLTLNSQHVKDEAVFAISQRCPNLQSLHVEGCKEITDESLLAVAQKCLDLQTLKLIYCWNLSMRPIIAATRNCSRLQNLSLANFTISDEFITEIMSGNLRNLECLDVQRCKYPANHFLSALSGGCPKLENLFLDLPRAYITSLSMPHGFPKLKSLDLIGDFTDEAFIYLIQKCPNLQSLGIADCPQLTDESVVAATQNVPNLRKLSLRIVKKMTTRSITSTALGFPELQEFNLFDSYSNTSNEAIIEATSQGWTKLRYAHFISCPHIKDDSILAIAQKCSNLQGLDISYCQGITNQGILALEKHCPTVRVTFLNCYETIRAISMRPRNFPSITST